MPTYDNLYTEVKFEVQDILDIGPGESFPSSVLTNYFGAFWDSLPPSSIILFVCVCVRAAGMFFPFVGDTATMYSNVKYVYTQAQWQNGTIDVSGNRHLSAAAY